MTDVLLAHLVGDYLLQSHWLATEKTRRWWPAAAHAALYGLPFLLVTLSPPALAVIVGTHAVIDRYRLARYVTWASNRLASAGHRSELPRWSDVRATGYPPELPPWLAGWLLIVVDNTLHLLLSVAAVRWL